MAAFAINNHASSATTHTPFFLTYGRHPRMNFDLRRGAANESAQEFATRMKKSWEDAKAALRLAGETMKRHYDKSKRPPHAFKVGDLVLVDALRIQSDRPAKKLDDKRHGPFKILEKVGLSAYRLELPRQWKRIHPVFNEAKLTPFVPPYADHQKRQNDWPPPDIIEEKEEYEVEKILEHWDSGQVNVIWNFKVKWKGY